MDDEIRSGDFLYYFVLHRSTQCKLLGCFVHDMESFVFHQQYAREIFIINTKLSTESTEASDIELISAETLKNDCSKVVTEQTQLLKMWLLI